MKKSIQLIILVVFSLLTLFGCAQYRFALNPGEGIYNYEYKFNKSQKEIYYLAQEYLAITYVSKDDVVQLENPETGKIILKALQKYRYNGDNENIRYLLVLNCKDNEITVQFNLNGMNEWYPDKVEVMNIEKKIQFMALDLKDYILNNSTSDSH